MIEAFLQQYNMLQIFMWAIFIIAGVIILDNVLNKK